MRIFLAFALVFASFTVRGQGTPRTLETLSQLLATDPVKFATAGKLVYLVGGYRTNGDWGAPREIAWDSDGTATTNLGCVWSTITTNGQWVAKDCESGEVDVRRFGIQPGSTNYASANQAAWVNLVDYVTADGINDHQPVRFPVGSFYFTGPLNLYNSSATPGAGYDSGRFIVQGSGQESSWVYLTGLTNNGFVGVYSGIQIRDLTVSSTAARKAAILTDAWTGNAIHLEKVDGLPAFHDIRNVVVREQPGSGIFLSGSIELLSAKNVIAMNNMREGFTLTRRGGEAGPFMNYWDSCRAAGNQQGGWSVTNAYNNVFSHCEAIDNFGEAHFRTFSGVNLTFDNCDIESPSSKTAPAAPLTTNTVVFGTNLVVVPGYDFATAGVAAGQYMIVTNSVSNDRAWRVLSAVGDTITVDGVWGWNVNESSTNNVTLAFTTAIPGLVLRAAIGTRVVGGYWGTLPTAIVLQNPVDSVIDWPYFVNASLVNWVGSECVLRTTAGGTNQMFRFRPTAPTGFRTVFRDQYGDTGWKDSLFYGAIPSYFRVGDESKASPFEVYGGAGGASVIKMYRPELPQTMGFAVSQWAGAGKMNILDADDFVVAAGGVGDALEPRWFIGQDGAASFPNTNVVLAVGRRITGETNATGVSLKLEGQAGTGTGQSGWVLLGNFDPTTAGTNVQTASKYRLGVHPGGVKIHDVGLTLPSTPYAGAALEVTSTSKGFLPPRMTTAQRLAISGPIAGLSVYDSDLSGHYYHDGTNWNRVALLPDGGTSSNFFRGDGVFTNIVPIAPTNNGAYVLFVTNGVASWIAHP